MNKYKIAYGIYNQLDRINNDEMYLKAKGASLFYLERSKHFTTFLTSE